MTQFFANPFLLTGLAATVLPFLAHLLSRRRFMDVEWGAMQFLNPSRKSRRRLQLEELLLLLIRAGLIACLVTAAARPLIPGGWLWGYHSQGRRAVVIIVDGSTSMTRRHGLATLHQQAVRQAERFLATLAVGDSCALIDARDQMRMAVPDPLTDLQVVRDELRGLPEPAGACNIPAAIEQAVAVLGRTTAAAREIVVFTDSQRESWRIGDEAAWDHLEDILSVPAVRPRLWVSSLDRDLPSVVRQISVSAPELNREMTVPGFPLRVRTRIRNGGESTEEVPVRLLLDGQPLAGEMQQVTIPPDSEMEIEFEHRLRTAGSHLLTVAADLQDDPVQGDNQRDAVVQVVDAVRILMISGGNVRGKASRNTSFAELAFSGSDGEQGWVQPLVVNQQQVRAADLEGAETIICSDVASLSDDFMRALQTQVAAGAGLLITCGPNCGPAAFNRLWSGSDGLLTGLTYAETINWIPVDDQSLHVAPLSIRAGWLDRFRSDPSRSFLQAVFSSYGRFSAEETMTPEGLPIPEPVVLAQLNSGEPLLLETRYGAGRVLLLTTSLDRSWTDFPARADFVPFLHESVFHLASARQNRNLRAGEPLVLRLSAGNSERDDVQTDAGAAVVFSKPDGSESEAALSRFSAAVNAVLADTSIPGVYRARQKSSRSDDLFAVNYDRSEDSFGMRSTRDEQLLSREGMIRFVETADDLSPAMYASEASIELWAMLMIGFLVLLIVEGFATSRVVSSGGRLSDSVVVPAEH